MKMMDLFNRGLLENELMTNAWDNQAFLDSSPEGSVGAPSGVQPTPPNPQANKDPIRNLLGLGSFLPGIGGDLLGPIADLRAMQQDPDKRTLANLALFGVGALPVIPSMVWMMNRKVANPIQRGMFSNQSGALGYHGTNNPNFDNSEFNPLSHFGSRPQAAEERVGLDSPTFKSILSSDSGDLKVLDTRHIRKVDLNIKKPLRIDDYEGNHSPIDFVRAAADKNALTDKEYNALIDIDKIDSTKTAPALIKALKRKGYDGFVYKNIAEDIGQDSYVIFDKSQVHQGIGRKESAFGDIPKQEGRPQLDLSKYYEVFDTKSGKSFGWFPSKDHAREEMDKLKKEYPFIDYEKYKGK